jgi:hypothetical protein
MALLEVARALLDQRHAAGQLGRPTPASASFARRAS